MDTIEAAPQRATERLTGVLEESYDMCGDPSTPVQDLLTDVLHLLDFYQQQYPDRDDLDVDNLLQQARWMRDDEAKDPYP
jgi:hypothetical protein